MSSCKWATAVAAVVPHNYWLQACAESRGRGVDCANIRSFSQWEQAATGDEDLGAAQAEDWQ